MILKNIGESNNTTSLYYELTFRISWEQLIGIIHAIMKSDFNSKVNTLLVGEIAGSKGIDKLSELIDADYNIQKSTIAQKEQGWISISGYSKTMETNIQFTLWNQLNRCLVEIENEPYLEKEGDHVYDKYVNSIEVTGFAFYAREDERKRMMEKKENHSDNTITIECFACHEKFEITCNAPTNQKTFYCTCPKCKAEIKRGNPNYVNNEN